jgi:hypothetical protein
MSDSAPEPAFTAFERELDKIADPIFRAGRTGYAWGPVDALLIKELGLDGPVRCKKATTSGRAANVLVESNDKSIELYLIFIGGHYSREAFIRAAENRISRFPNVRTVAVADKDGGHWRVRSIVERAGVGLAEEIQASFPAVSDGDVHRVEAKFEEQQPDGTTSTTSKPPEEVPIAAPDEFTSAMRSRTVELGGLSELPGRFVDLAAKNGIVVDVTTATDLLAAVLSSQLVLFAGPSGTGKSTFAIQLQRFFCDQERTQTFEARRQWLSPDDLVGYYSVLGKQFATTADTEKLIALHEASIGSMREPMDAIEGPPVLLIEEINLSAPEGYLGPVIHGLSRISTPYLEWSLHSRATGALDEASSLSLPQRAMIGPYPRVLGTINVDVTAQAPARKVAARSCVVLLEPTPLTADGVEELIDASLEDVDEIGPETAPGAAFLGDPLTALRGLGEEERAEVTTMLLRITQRLGGALVSRRDVLRCLAYMAYYLRLTPDATASSPQVELAAENAVLHCVLPTLDSDRFVPALEELSKSDLAAGATDGDSLGGLLGSRVARLLAVVTSGLGIAESIDFWTALS